jgi:hypothetical protein
MEKRNELEQLFYKVYLDLGGSNIEVELEDDDYNVAFDDAIRTYRTYSTNSVHQGFHFMSLNAGQQTYKIPEEIDSIKEIRRFRSNLLIGGGQGFDPFSASFLQQTLRSRDHTFPGLVNYEALTQFHEQIGRMFGEHVMFTFNEGTSELHIWKNIRAPEEIVLECSAVKSIDTLLKDSAAYRWLRRYTLARVKMILGEKYSKVATIPGPQGGTVLKGTDLKSDGVQEIELLEQDLLDYADGGEAPMPFFG